jgi:hypothetical protein
MLTMQSSSKLQEMIGIKRRSRGNCVGIHSYHANKLQAPGNDKCEKKTQGEMREENMLTVQVNFVSISA